MSVEVNRANRDRTALRPLDAFSTEMPDGHVIVTPLFVDKKHEGSVATLHRERCRIYAIQNNLPRLNRREPLVGVAG